jgi:hypothetical protein
VLPDVPVCTGFQFCSRPLLNEMLFLFKRCEVRWETSHLYSRQDICRLQLPQHIHMSALNARSANLPPTERARSISPQKSSPASTPPPPPQRSSQAPGRLDLTLSPKLDSPRPSRDGVADAMDTPGTNMSTSPSKENRSPFDFELKRASVTSPSSVSSAGNPSPLSWQRRPNSQSVDKPRSRPLSMVAAENAARTSMPPEPASATELGFSKTQIAQSLSAKDPSWFRQTPDRGQTSAAYRRNQVEDEDRSDMPSMRAQLPGMSSTPSPSVGQPSSSHSRSRSSAGRLGSPLALADEQRLDPPRPSEYEPASRSPERSPSRTGGRMSPARPASPTKGLGGFVQSAMMKRTDSVKRWSVNAPPSLARADSVASSRPNPDKVGTNSQPNSRSRPASMIRDGSMTPTSRPTSRHEGLHGEEKMSAGSSTSASASQDVADPTPETKPHSNATTTTSHPRDIEENTTPPSSPSKTMDTRRWSPTKSSWLDAALKKEESPKPKPPAPSSQPAWMVELNKAKALKATNPDAGETSKPGAVSHKHEAKLGGVMRSSPIGVTKSITAGFGSAYSSNSTKLSTTTEHQSAPSTTEFRGSLPKSSSSTPPDATKPESVPDDPTKPGSTDDTLRTGAKVDATAKMDFRANLKPRQPPPTGDKGGNANEFQNVFGNLRKTKTQNFVAPDELKENILRGKAALNFTGGPKKPERTDEFKEAILKKKKEFEKVQMEGKGIARSATTATEKSVPEGLAKRSELGRSTTVSKRDSVSSDTSRARSSIISNRDSVTSSLAKVEAPTQSPAPAPGLKPFMTPKRESVEVAPKRASLQKSPPPVSSPGSIAAKESVGVVASRLSSRAAAGSLADRFNPALAGMLARGPPPMAAGKKSVEDSGASKPSSAAEPSDTPGPGPQLTHMTKNRARGPRRKAPSSAPSTDTRPSVSCLPSTAAPAPSTDLATPAPVETSPLPSASLAASPDIEEASLSSEKQIQLTDSEKTKSPAGWVAPVNSSNKAEVAERVTPVNSTPEPTSKGQIKLVDSAKMYASGQVRLVDSGYVKPTYSPYTRRQDSISSISNAPDQIRLVDSSAVRASYASSSSRGSYQASPTPKDAATFQSGVGIVQEKEELTAHPPSPKKLDVRRMSKFLDDSSQSPIPDLTPRPESPKRSSPTRSPTRFSHQASQSVQQASVPEVAGRPRTPRSRSRSPTKMGEARPPLTPGPMSPPPLTSPLRSPTKQTMEVSALLDEFFGPERPGREYRADAADLLMNRPAAGCTVKTTGAQLFQIFGDGKKMAVPAHNERVLFEREMYICPHNFTNEAGKKQCEVYFWAGDEVPQATVEDVQVFVNREAKGFGGRVVSLRQGKETAEFLQALGGIVITRRGSNNKYDSLAPNMLCGRRHLGQVAFDEVDYSPASLCSGFAYLITQAGRCFLWKGKGSDVDELGCARLVGMDLTLTGELEEVDDGSEPAAFWDIFNGGEKPQSADHWRLKPNYGQYAGRLFRSDATSKKQASSAVQSTLDSLVICTNRELDRLWKSTPLTKPICVLTASTSSMPSSRCTS